MQQAKEIEPSVSGIFCLFGKEFNKRDVYYSLKCQKLKSPVGALFLFPLFSISPETPM